MPRDPTVPPGNPLLRGLVPEDRPALAGILREAGVFSSEEVDVALELIDIGLGRREGGGYEFLVADVGGETAGYACFGRAPMTDGTWDLYWIAVGLRWRGRGVGAKLMRAVEDAARAGGCRLLVVETAGRPAYDATRDFYERMGYPETSRVEDFYADGDDKVFHARRLR